MTKYYFTILYFVLIICFSCEEQGFIINCSECTEVEPYETLLIITLDMHSYALATEVRVYEGNLEDDILFFKMSVSGNRTHVTVPVNKKYTVTATIHYPDQQVYIAVDSAFPRIRYVEELCKNPCFLIYDSTVNLSIKYRS